MSKTTRLMGRKGLAVATSGLAPIAPIVTIKPRFGMRVTVRLECGQVQQYDGLFSHTFDAYDDALDRFADASRIEVKLLVSVPVRSHGLPLWSPA